MTLIKPEKRTLFRCPTSGSAILNFTLQKSNQLLGEFECSYITGSTLGSGHSSLVDIIDGRCGTDGIVAATNG